MYLIIECVELFLPVVCPSDKVEILGEALRIRIIIIIIIQNRRLVPLVSLVRPKFVGKPASI